MTEQEEMEEYEKETNTLILGIVLGASSMAAILLSIYTFGGWHG